jgi:hypothetical protein
MLWSTTHSRLGEVPFHPITGLSRDFADLGPSDESLGYYQMPLRGSVTATHRQDVCNHEVMRLWLSASAAAPDSCKSPAASRNSPPKLVGFRLYEAAALEFTL